MPFSLAPSFSLWLSNLTLISSSTGSTGRFFMVPTSPMLMSNRVLFHLPQKPLVRSLQRIFTLGTPSSPVTQKAVSMIMFWSFFETCEVTAMQLIASTWCLPLKRVRGWCFFIMGDCFIVCHQIWVGRRPVYCASSFGHVRWVGFSKWCSQVVWRHSYISSVMWGFIIKVYLKSSQEPRVF